MHVYLFIRFIKRVADRHRKRVGQTGRHTDQHRLTIYEGKVGNNPLIRLSTKFGNSFFFFSIVHNSRSIAVPCIPLFFHVFFSFFFHFKYFVKFIYMYHFLIRIKARALKSFSADEWPPPPTSSNRIGNISL